MHGIPSLSFSPDSNPIATGSIKLSIIICDFQTYDMVQGPFPAHNVPTNAVSVSPDSRQMCTVPSILRTTDRLSLEARMGRSRCGMPKLENLQGRIYLVHSHPFTSSRSHRMASSSGRPIVVCDVNTFTGKRRNLSRHQLHIHVLRLHPPRLHPTSPNFKDVITNSTDDPSELSLTPVLTT